MYVRVPLVVSFVFFLRCSASPEWLEKYKQGVTGSCPVTTDLIMAVMGQCAHKLKNKSHTSE